MYAIMVTKTIRYYNVQLHEPKEKQVPEMSPWCSAGNGGMDPYSSPRTIPNTSLHNPFLHSRLRTRQM